MKKLISAFALSFFLATASAASAAVQEFGPDFARFTLDVPAGWTTQNVDGGVQLINAAKDTSLAVVVAKTENKDCKNLAEMLAKASGYDKPTFADLGDNTWSISGTINGGEVNTIVGLEDGKMVVLTMAGKDMDTVSKICDSLTDK